MVAVDLEEVDNALSPFANNTSNSSDNKDDANKLHPMVLPDNRASNNAMMEVLSLHKEAEEWRPWFSKSYKEL